MNKPIPKLPTLQRLEHIALHYLERFSATTEGVRLVLLRRVHKACHAHEEDPAAFYDLVEQVIEKLNQNGYLNDTAFAETRVNNLHRQGRGQRWISENLKAKGVDRHTIQTVLDDFSQDNPDAEWEAALTLARKRGFGPFQPDEETRQKRRDKDFSSMMRAGFSYDIVRRIMGYSPD